MLFGPSACRDSKNGDSMNGLIKTAINRLIFRLKNRKMLSQIKMAASQGNMEYGLHPTIWRAIRRKAGCSLPVPFRDHTGEVIFPGHISRYGCRVHIPKGRFSEISWKRTIEGLPLPRPGDVLLPDVIAIGIDHYDY